MPKAILAITGTTKMGSGVAVNYNIVTDSGTSWGSIYLYNFALTRVNNRTNFKQQVINQAADRGITLATTDIEVYGD